jgi:hypothetical protein
VHWRQTTRGRACLEIGRLSDCRTLNGDGTDCLRQRGRTNLNFESRIDRWRCGLRFPHKRRRLWRSVSEQRSTVVGGAQHVVTGWHVRQSGSDGFRDCGLPGLTGRGRRDGRYTPSFNHGISVVDSFDYWVGDHLDGPERANWVLGGGFLHRDEEQGSSPRRILFFGVLRGFLIEWLRGRRGRREIGGERSRCPVTFANCRFGWGRFGCQGPVFELQIRNRRWRGLVVRHLAEGQIKAKGKA